MRLWCKIQRQRLAEGYFYSMQKSSKRKSLPRFTGLFSRLPVRKSLLFICLLPSLAVMAQQQGWVQIEGELKGDLKGYNRIYMYTRLTNDSAEIKDGHYRFRFPYSKPGMQMLYPQYTKAMRQIYQPFGILITGPGTYHVYSDISKGMHASRLEGPEDMILYKKFEDDQAAAIRAMNEKLSDRYGKSWWSINEKSPYYSSFIKTRDSLEQHFVVPVIDALVKNHPNSYASAFALAGAGRQTGSLAVKKSWLEHLSPTMRKTAAGKEFADYIQGLTASEIGSRVANFTLMNEKGKPVQLNQFKGKYLLIDFWASWCVPCRRSFPHWREVYKKYHANKNFEILAVSIDENKQAWLQAVAEENNPWPQVLDNKNLSQRGFAVTSIPHSFLISPDGKILAQEVGFEPDQKGEIEKLLEKIFDN